MLIPAEIYVEDFDLADSQFPGKRYVLKHEATEYRSVYLPSGGSVQGHNVAIFKIVPEGE